MLNIKKLLTKILKRLPTYTIPINGATYTGTTSNAWEYVGKSITVASGHVAIVTCVQNYSSGRPMGIGLGTNASANPPLYFAQHATESVYRATFMLTAGTWYLYTKRATVPSAANSYHIYKLDFDVS